VRNILAVTTITILLSQEREGTPKSLLEAAAMGKALVSTDVPGCREVVKPAWNGFLVPPKRPMAVVSALDDLLTDSVRLATFGRNSRTLAESEFDVNSVNDRILTELYGLRLPESRVHRIVSSCI
jgi:glycosyltransferase involved in cell wall biosynthesis